MDLKFSPHLDMKHFFFTLTLLFTTGLSSVHAQQNANPQQNTNPNLALGKKFVSSDPSTLGWDSGLTDGSWAPAKGTTYATGDAAAFPKTVTLDLEKEQSLGYVGIGVPNFGSTKTVSVSLSTDNTEFSEVGRYAFRVGYEERHLFEFAAKNARYVRLTYLDFSPEQLRRAPTIAFTTELMVFAPGEKPVIPGNPALDIPADTAAPKVNLDGSINKTFAAMHQSFLERDKQGPIGLLFVGDSITDHWRRSNAKDIWARFARYEPANFGIAGDRTQHVLWRFEQGELDGIKPKVVVLMIGTNNIRVNSVDQIVQADTKIVAEIHRRLPDTKVLLLGIFPRAASATDPLRAKVKEINVGLAKLEDGNKTRFLDIGDKFLEANGTLSKEIMPDALHPSPKGYAIWADAMSPLLDEMMK